MLLRILLLAGVALSGYCCYAAEHKECTSIDIRNDCNRMHILDNCTVVTGYVMITLMPSQKTCNYSEYSYPDLREITEFLIMTEVRGLISISKMFPSLTVIRGRRLFLNYALGITNMPDLQTLEFPSLVAIQRGHVYLGSCPKLCQLEKINWDRLTLSTGENHIMMGSHHCDEPVICNGCQTNYCWSTRFCQRFENDNVVKYNENIKNCHKQCLGGCYSSSGAPDDCRVCRRFTNAGVCVDRCPSDKFIMEQHQRCYSRQECVNDKRHFTHGFSCVAFCPSGYKSDEESNCVRCEPTEPCVSVCSPEKSDEAITIYNLADADELRGCQIVNGSLVITIRSKVQEQQLMKSLSSIREIRGHLKIYRSSQLTSLQFLRNLERIHGDPLENNHYALILYDNKHLRDLWTPAVRLEFDHGGMFMHRNNKLCNRVMSEFRAEVIHDKTMDSLQTSDQEVLCGPAKLQLGIQVRSHRRVQLNWPIGQTSAKVEVIYRPLPEGKFYPEESELEAPVCTRINWQRRLLFPDELQRNATHYSYQLEELAPNTRYVCLVKTFGGDPKHEARSDLNYLHTRGDIPRAPTMKLSKKTDSSLTLSLKGAGNSTSNYYQLLVYELPDDKGFLDARNYCKQPAYLDQEMDRGKWLLPPEDYDDCCAHQAEMADDLRFIENMREEYRCSLDRPQNCIAVDQPLAAQIPYRQIRLPGNFTSYVLPGLRRFRPYSLQLQACNELGCSSPFILNERTNYTLGADLLTDLNACRIPPAEEGHLDEYVVRFSEPEQPNGVILSYTIHYREKSAPTVILQNDIECVPRFVHAADDFVHVVKLNGSFNECAVRVRSLAGDVMTVYVPISICNAEQRVTSQPHSHSSSTTNTLHTSEDHSHTRSISIFLLCILFGASVAIVWVMYKRRCWRKLPGLRRYLPVREEWLRERQPTEDRQVLVDNFDRVLFQNQNDSNSSNNADEI